MHLPPLARVVFSRMPPIVAWSNEKSAMVTVGQSRGVCRCHDVEQAGVARMGRR